MKQVFWAALIWWVGFSGFGLAYELNDKLAIGGVLAGAYQYQLIDEAAGVEDTGRGAVALQPEVTVTLTRNDKIFAKFGFAAGNSLGDETSPFALSSWAADQEDDVKNINGRSRDYLLVVRYTHVFVLNDSHTIELAGGIIDATDYLDENAFANCEYTQFMNQGLVNAANSFLPSYDIGAAVQWQYRRIGVKGVAMNVGENSDGQSFNYFGTQFNYRLDSTLGQGNYRLIANATSRDFANVAGDRVVAKRSYFISCDQRLGDRIGVWIRIGWQNDASAKDYNNLYSGGLDISGSVWGRQADNVGIGYARLGNGNQEIETSQVLEAYYRLVFNDIFALTADLQFLRDDNEHQEDMTGWIWGLRATAAF